MASISLDKIKTDNPDWTNFSVFLENGDLLLSTVEVNPETIQGYMGLYRDYDFTVKEGLFYNGVHYHVHRFYEGLIYGRADPGTKRTDGFCLVRFNREGKIPLHLIFTYDLPTVSARIIPEANKYFGQILDQFP